MSEPTRAAIYCRLSNDPEGDKSSIGRQERECRDRASREGWEVSQVYKDSDTSAFQENVKRPSFDRMMEDAKAGQFSKLLIFKADRLHRRMIQALQTFDDLERAGVQVVSLNDPGLDNAIVRAVIAGIAEQESRNTSIRAKVAKKEAAFNGKARPSGYRAFGLNADWTAEVKEEADLIREAADRYLKGEGLTGIVKDWKARGIKGTTGTPISRIVLRQILESPRVAGLSEYQGTVVAKGNWPAIIDEATWERLRINLAKNKKLGVRKTGKYLLSPQIVSCGLCGGKMNGRLMGGTGKKPRYRCDDCQRVSIQAEFLETAVWKILSQAYESKRVQKVRASKAAGETDQESQTLDAEIEALKVKLALATDDFYVQGLMPREVFLDTAKALNDAIQQKEQRLSELQALDILGDLKAGETLLDTDKPLPWKKAMVELAIARITILPSTMGGNRLLNHDRIQIAWRI